MVIIKVISFFLITAVGFGSEKAGWLPRKSAEYLSNVVANIAGPCVVMSSMVTEKWAEGKLYLMLVLLLCIFILYFFIYLFSIGFTKVLKLPDENGVAGIYKNFLLFTNNGFLGFPLVLIIFGKTGLFPMVTINTVIILLVFTLGIHNLGIIESKKDFVKHFLSFPVTSSIVAILLFCFNLGRFVPDFLVDILDMIGGMMAPLAMITIGIQLADSHIKKLLLNHNLIIMCIFRLVVLPAIIFLLLIFLSNILPEHILKFFHLSPMIICIITMNFLLPCGALPGTLAEKHGKDGTLAAEGIFLSTFFSIFTITVWTAVFNFYL